MSSKERVDPGVIELRAVLLLKRDLGRAGGQSVRVELNGDDSVLKEGASPLPITKCGFIVSIDSAAELTILAFAGHLSIEEGEDAAADVVGLTVWVETKVYDVGLKVVQEVELLTRSKSMQQREKTGSTSAGGKGAKKGEAAELTFQKDQGAKLQIGKFTMSIHKGEELQEMTKNANRKGNRASWEQS